MAMGVLVGLAVNVTIFPPLTLDAARAQISRGRLVLIEQLKDAAKTLVQKWPRNMRIGLAADTNWPSWKT